MRLGRAVAVVCLVVAVAGCSDWQNDRGRGDAPVGSIDDDPANITNFPDQFSNVATKCAAGAPGWRLFVTTSDYANVVAVQDEACRG